MIGTYEREFKEMIKDFTSYYSGLPCYSLCKNLKGIHYGSERMRKNVKTENGVIIVSPRIPAYLRRKSVAREIAHMLGDFSWFNYRYGDDETLRMEVVDGYVPDIPNSVKENIVPGDYGASLIEDMEEFYARVLADYREYIGVLHTDLRGIKLGSTRMRKKVKTENGVITISPKVPDKKKRKLVALELSKLIGDSGFYQEELEKEELVEMDYLDSLSEDF